VLRLVRAAPRRGCVATGHRGDISASRRRRWASDMRGVERRAERARGRPLDMVELTDATRAAESLLIDRARQRAVCIFIAFQPARGVAA